jgi:hypothetical protein
MWCRIRNLFDPGSGIEKIRIRDKHPGSTTLILANKKNNKSTLEKFRSRIGGTPAESVQLVAGHKLVGETKVRNLDVHLAVQQKVLGLQVPTSQKLSANAFFLF